MPELRPGEGSLLSSFGFLTMAHDASSLRRARGLARSLRRHEPGAAIGLLAVGELGPKPEEFSLVVPLAGREPFSAAYRFFNKLLALASHAPFERNLFLDDDVLVLGPLSPTVEASFAGLPFAFNCDVRASDQPFAGANHVDPGAVARELGVGEVFDPYGGGHVYYERRTYLPYFREAIMEVLFEPRRYERLSGDGFLSDEVALAIVANRHHLRMPCLEGWIDPLGGGRAEHVELDVERGVYHDPHRARGTDKTTRLLHFFGDGKGSAVYERALGTLLDGAGNRPGVWRRLTHLFGRALDR